MNLFETESSIDVHARNAVRTPETCPKCGMMAEYVERFSSGLFMASHGSAPRKVSARLTVKSARICHGFEKVSHV